MTVDYEGAFKQNFVTNAFNGCEDILVLDRIFRQVGDMIKFRKELLSKAPPKSLKDVVKNLIPPKSIARSVEGSELLDYMTDASKIENVVVGDVESTTSDVEEEELEETKENTTTSATFEMLLNVPSTLFVLLTGHSMNNELEEDASFLNEKGRLFDSHKTSTLFLAHRTKLFSDYNEARRSVKRRIEPKNK